MYRESWKEANFDELCSLKVYKHLKISKEIFRSFS